MGIHDYVDFIQRNDQCLIRLQLYKDDDYDANMHVDSYGCSKAVLVRVPLNHSKRDILSWSLTEFAKFPIINVGYSWDDWDFEPSLGYDEILQDDGKWYDLAIWQSKHYPDEWLVNFEPTSYKTFVLGEDDPNLVSWAFYVMIFTDRNDSYPCATLLDEELSESNCKIRAFNMIVNYGSTNLYIYDNKRLEQIQDINYIEALQRHNANPLFSQIHMYQYQRPPELSHARFQVLLEDNIRSVELLNLQIIRNVRLPSLPKLINNTFVYDAAPYNFDDNKIGIRFTPQLRIHLSLELSHGCIVCGGGRAIGHYSCYDHIDQEYDHIQEYYDKVRQEYIKLIQNIELVEKSTLPCKLSVTFTERQTPYDIVLSL